MKQHQVTITKRKVRSEAIELEVKRFYVPGHVLKTKCPKCGSKYERDFGDEYLSYPTAGVTFSEHLCCYAQKDDGSYCEHEWEVDLRLDITLTAPQSRSEGT